MKNFKKALIIGVVVLTIGAMSLTAFAASGYGSPAEIIAGLTGKSVETVTAERAEGQTYGSLAADAGKLDEFKKEMLELKKTRLAELVKNGTITQERADEILAAMEKNQETCDGTGSAQIGKKMGGGLGFMNGGRGRGQGGRGRGMGMGGGSCLGR